MPSPVSPDAVKALVPGPTGNFCEKYLVALGTPKLFSDWFSYAYNSDGSFSDLFIADLCATQCFGAGGGGPVVVPPGGLAAPTGLMATDGDFSTQVNVAWVSVVTATGYDVYRSLTNDSATATVIASLGQVTMYADTGVDPGQIYWYWVKAKKVGVISAFSAPDSGFAAQTTLTVVSDLKASRGFYAATVTGATTGSGTLALVFTASPSPANSYDIYRGITNDFAAATRIDTDRMPFDTARKTTTCAPTPCTKPLFVNNGGHLIYHDKPPEIVRRYYYWVVAKQLDGTTVIGVSGASNSAYGWVVFDSTVATQIVGYDVVSVGIAPALSAGARAYVVLVGSVAGGGGGGDAFGGGGGGGAAIIAGYFAMTAGPNRRWKLVSASAAGGAAGVNGSNSGVAELQYDPNTAAFATILSTTAAGGGVQNGAGGAGSTGTVVGAVTSTETEAGKDGEAAAGLFGGRGGCAFGVLRSNPHNFPNIWNIGTESGRTTQGGGGSDALPGNGGLADGGIGSTGYAIIVYY